MLGSVSSEDCGESCLVIGSLRYYDYQTSSYEITEYWGINGHITITRSDVR